MGILWGFQGGEGDWEERAGGAGCWGKVVVYLSLILSLLFFIFIFMFFSMVLNFLSGIYGISN